MTNFFEKNFKIARSQLRFRVRGASVYFKVQGLFSCFSLLPFWLNIAGMSYQCRKRRHLLTESLHGGKVCLVGRGREESISKQFKRSGSRGQSYQFERTPTRGVECSGVGDKTRTIKRFKGNGGEGFSESRGGKAPDMT